MEKKNYKILKDKDGKSYLKIIREEPKVKQFKQINNTVTKKIVKKKKKNPKKVIKKKKK